MCSLFSCVFLFVAIAKMCRREEISCLFQSADESNGTHQVLELKESQGCKVWQLNEKSHVSIQDSSFVAKKYFDKEKFKIVVAPTTDTFINFQR